MATSRIYHPAPLVLSEKINLNSEAVHHVARVLRKRVSDPIILFNGNGGEYHGRITAILKKEVTVELMEFQKDDRLSPLDIHLGQALCSNEKMDWVIQKAVELGVREITPVITQYTSVKLPQERHAKRLQHWQAKIIAACEQCGLNRLPKISLPLALKDWLSQQHNELHLLLDPRQASTLKEITIKPRSVSLLIGPEGGLHDDEILMAKECQFTPIKLGARILRTETAAVGALAVLQSLWGDC